MGVKDGISARNLIFGVYGCLEFNFWGLKSTLKESGT